MGNFTQKHEQNRQDQQQHQQKQNKQQQQQYQKENQHSANEQIKFDPLKYSQFNQLKEQGNEIYKKITQECQKNTIDNKTIKLNLSQSQLYYEQALRNAQYLSQKAQIHKNIAMVNFKKIFYKCDIEQNITLLHEGIDNLNKAIDYSQQDNRNPDLWYNQLNAIKFQAANDVINTVLNKQDDIELQSNLIELSNKISLKLEPQIHLIIQRNIISITEKQIFNLNQQDNMRDMIQAENLQIQINLNIQKFYSLSKEISSEEIQFYYQERASKINETTLQYQAQKHLYHANNIYKSEQDRKIKEKGYDLNQSIIIQDAIDAYKSAISAVKHFEGKFLDIEGECSFMLAQIYLELNGEFCQKAHIYLRNSIQFYLSSSSSERTRSKKWFFGAQQTMELLQNKNIMLDEQEYDLWKSNNSELVEQIEKNVKNGCVEFVKWVVQNHLPDNKKNFQFQQSDFDNKKKLLHKTMKIFHGDKITNETQHFKFIAKCVMIHLVDFHSQYK